MSRWVALPLLGVVLVWSLWNIESFADTPYQLYLRAAQYEATADMRSAMYWYKRSADAGDVDAELRLGKLYREGKRIQADYTLSAHYYEMAAKQGNPVAEYKVGTMYYGGQGVVQSNHTAEIWFRRSAGQGLPEAIHALDVMRANGHCCDAMADLKHEQTASVELSIHRAIHPSRKGTIAAGK